jgi:hypothetical protein
MTTAPGTIAVTTARDLISSRMFGRLTGRIITDHGTDEQTAGRIIDQAPRVPPGVRPQPRRAPRPVR